MGFSTFDPGGCNCSTPGQTFSVVGCNNLGYAGLTVTVKDPTDTTTYASGTTDASGNVTLTWSGTMTNVWVHVTGQSARFQAFDNQFTLTSGGTTPLGLSAATGYDCAGVNASCLQPTADTLHCSWTGSLSAYSPQVLTVNGTTLAEWVGSFVDGLGNTWEIHCDGETVYFFEPTAGCTVTATSSTYACPPSFSVTASLDTFCGAIHYTMSVTVTE